MDLEDFSLVFDVEPVLNEVAIEPLHFLLTLRIGGSHLLQKEILNCAQEQAQVSLKNALVTVDANLAVRNEVGPEFVQQLLLSLVEVLDVAQLGHDLNKVEEGDQVTLLQLHLLVSHFD